MKRKHSKARRVVTFHELQWLVRSGRLTIDVRRPPDGAPPRGALHCRCPILADVTGIDWITGSDYLRRHERRAWRHALERASYLHAARHGPQGGASKLRRPVWTWYRPDGSEVIGGAL